MVIFWDKIPINEKRLIYCAITETVQINYSQWCTLNSDGHDDEPLCTFFLIHTEKSAVVLFLLFTISADIPTICKSFRHEGIITD